MTTSRWVLAILLAVVATGVISWLLKKSYDAKVQRAAVQGLELNEGIVQFDTTLNVPQWLRKAIGEEHFRDEKTIDLATNRGFKKGTNELKVTRETLKHLRSLTGVETLELGNQRGITDVELELLTPLKDLTTLYLYRTGVRGPGLIHIAPLPKLQSLSLEYTSLEDSGVKHLGGMQSLTWLHLDNTQVTDAGMVDLARASALKTLSLGNTEITDAGLTHLEQLRYLEELVLTGTNVTAEGVARLQKKLPHCRVFTTFGLGMDPDDELLFPAGYQPTADEINARLKELNIDGEVRTDANRPGHPIVSLYLFSCTLSDRVVLSLIEHMPDLEKLNLRGALVGDDLMSGLNLTGIKMLSLDGTRISDDALPHLSQLSNLVELNLTQTNVTDEGLLHLERLSQMEFLLLDRTRVTDDGIERLQQALPNCTINR